MDFAYTVLAVLGTIMVGAYCVIRNVLMGDSVPLEDEIANRELEIGKLQDSTDELKVEHDTNVEIEKKLEKMAKDAKHMDSELVRLSDEEIVDSLRDRGF